jgi:hypothetical protein
MSEKLPGWRFGSRSAYAGTRSCFRGRRFHLPLAFTVCGILLAQNAQSQSVEFPTFNSRVKISHWKTEASNGIGKKVAVSPTTDFYWTAFTDPIDDALLAALDSAGVKVTGCSGKYGSAIVYKFDFRGKRESALALLRTNGSFINAVPQVLKDKVDECIWFEKGLRYVDSAAGTIKALVVLSRDLPPEQFAAMAASFRISVESDPLHGRRYEVVGRPADLVGLARDDRIESVSWYPGKDPANHYIRQLMRVNELQTGFVTKIQPPSVDWLSGVRYTGDSIWIDFNEPGPYCHLDLCEAAGKDTLLRAPGPGIKRRDAALRKWGLTEHGVHVAGCAAGNGWLSLYDTLYGGDTLFRRGVAPKARIIPWYQDTGDVNNHSFGENANYYNAESQSNDYVLSNHGRSQRYFNNVSTYAACNNGIWRLNGNQQIGYYAILSNNKDAILVGATEKGRPLIACFSSLGPTRDGRIRPDVMAPGEGTLNAGWHIDMDSVAIVNNGVKVSWGFGAGQPGWGPLAGDGATDNYQISNAVLSNGCFSFDALSTAYCFSSAVFPQDTIISSVNDTLVIRWKITRMVPSSPRTMTCLLYLKRPQDSYVKNNDVSIWTKFPVTITGDFQTTRICLSDPSLQRFMGAWTDGDTIQRIRFDFVDPESYITSSLRNDLYGGVNWQGTSEATAAVSGLCALMLQKHRDDVLRPRNPSLTIHDYPPWNSTVRAILAHTARDMIDTVGICVGLPNPDFAGAGFSRMVLYGKGPDWATGYGLVDAVRALEYVSTNHFREDTVRQGQTMTYYFDVPASTPNLRVTLCWDDPYNQGIAQADAFHTKLVNDLDLYLQPPGGGAAARPWTLNHQGLHHYAIPVNGVDSLITPGKILGNPAQPGIDTVNNLEVVDVDNPVAGTWQAVVVGKSIKMKQSAKTGTTQDFSLVFDFSLRTALAKTAALPADSPAQQLSGATPSLPSPYAQPVISPAASIGTLSIAAPVVLSEWACSRTLSIRRLRAGIRNRDTLENFPLLVRLDWRMINFDQALPDGRDCMFTDENGRLLTSVVEFWDSRHRRAAVWVLIPRLAPGDNQDYILMLWGNPAAHAVPPQTGGGPLVAYARRADGSWGSNGVLTASDMLRWAKSQCASAEGQLTLCFTHSRKKPAVFSCVLGSGGVVWFCDGRKIPQTPACAFDPATVRNIMLFRQPVSPAWISAFSAVQK